MYTFILRDEEPREREDGRRRAGLNWEVEIWVGGGDEVVGEGKDGGGEGGAGEGRVLGGKVWVPWEAFRATYRGREVEGSRGLRREGVRGVGVMMRRYVLCFPFN